MIKGLAKFLLLLSKTYRRGKMLLFRRLFMCVGKNFVFDPGDFFSYQTISVGNDVYIGPGAKFNASNSAITLGNKIMFGPGATIMGGDHNTSVIGSYMYDVKEKLPENDLPVVIEDDVWIGACVTILKGVCIGEGSIIAAGAVVVKSIPSYSIAGGVPAKVIKARFSQSELTKHKQLIGNK